jgi:hypothetical protein
MSNQCVTLKLNIQNGDYLHTDKMIAHNTKVISGVPTSVPALSMAWDLKVAFYTHEGKQQHQQGIDILHD